MGGAFEHNFFSTMEFLQCWEENMRNAQEMRGKLEAIGMLKIDCAIIVKPYSEKNCTLGGNSVVIVLGLLM